jgi:hypothetical protein
MKISDKRVKIILIISVIFIVTIFGGIAIYRMKHAIENTKIESCRLNYYHGGKQYAMKYLSSEDFYNFYSAQYVIRICKDKEAVDLIGKHIRHNNPEVTMLALDCLEDIGDKEAIKYIESYIVDCQGNPGCNNLELIKYANQIIQQM